MIKMANPLPRPEVKAEHNYADGKSKVDVVISRDGKAKSYQGEGATNSEATSHVIRKILDDGHTAEYLP